MNHDEKRRERLKRAMRDDAVMRVCYVCGESAHVFHHTSYEPEETVMVCPTCHNKIHGNHHDQLEPDQERPDNYDTIRNRQAKVEQQGYRRASRCDDCGGTFASADLWLESPGEEGVVQTKNLLSSTRLADSSELTVLCRHCLADNSD